MYKKTITPSIRFFKVCASTMFMMLLFLNCKKNKEGTATESSRSIDTSATTMPRVDGIRIAWDYSTLKKLSPSNSGINYAGYSRMIQLHDGSLICVFEADGNVVAVKSDDLGITWSSAINIARPANGVNMSVPDILELEDRSLLVCYNPRPVKIDPSNHFAIKTKKSYDGGQTWVDERTVYEADYKFENGCWEPSAIQLPNGQIQLYFANEGIYTNSDEQNISMLRSANGGLDWSKEPQIISFRPGKRDGMPCPLIINGNKIAVSIEDNGSTTFKPYIIKNTISNNWAQIIGANSLDRSYALNDKIDDNIYAGAPYLRQLKTGETILSYQGTEDRANYQNFAEMKVVIGNNMAQNFNRKTSPFDIAADRSGLWNSVSVLGDNTVIALTSTNTYSANNATEVWMIKGYVIPKMTVNKQSITIVGVMNESAWQLPMPIFIGQKGLTQARANVVYDKDDLYLLAKVTDNKISTDHADIQANDGVCFYIDADNRSLYRPGKGIFKICITAGNKLAVYEGNDGNWGIVNTMTDIQHAIKITANGYAVEVGLPWKYLGIKPAAKSIMGFNMSLIENTGNNTAAYIENISSNLPDNPYSWSTITLQ